MLPDYQYALLEEQDTRTYAQTDPRGFLRQFSGPVILDEAQRVPELFSYIMGAVDNDNRPGRFVLSGSQNFLLMEAVTQSLAGRTAVMTLLPLSISELQGRPPRTIANLERGTMTGDDTAGADLFQVMHAGFYPRIHDAHIAAGEWLADYFQTYVQRDVRMTVTVGDLDAFTRFVQLCAGRVGQPLNLTSLGSDCGISHSTARRWLSILQRSYIVFLLKPHFKNFSKRIIKTPKLFFYDSGLLCWLLRIRSPEDLRMHASRGSIFESMVIADICKSYVHQRVRPPLYYWRDSTGHEVDLIIDTNEKLVPVEIKSAETFNPSMIDGLTYWRTIAGDAAGAPLLIIGGAGIMTYRDCRVFPWSVL